MKTKTILIIAGAVFVSGSVVYAVSERKKRKNIEAEIQALNEQSKNISVAVDETTQAKEKMDSLIDLIRKIGEKKDNNSKPETEPEKVKIPETKVKEKKDIPVKNEK